jgi:hypothetical protein
VAKVSSSRGGDAARTPALVPLERRLLRLRKLEAKRQRQLDRVHARAVEAAGEMADLLAAVKAWVDQPGARPAAAATTPPASESARRYSIRRLIGARASTS